MQKLILSIIAITNIGLGFEVAIDYEDAWLEYGGITTTNELQSDLTDGRDDPDEEADCDHCCHGIAHFAGVIITSATVPYLRASCAIPLSDKSQFFASRSPPTPPPNV